MFATTVKNTLRFQVICLQIQTHEKKEKDLDRSSRPFSGSDFSRVFTDSLR